MDIQPGDIIFIAIILWIVLEIINDDDSGGGHRSRIPVPVLSR